MTTDLASPQTTRRTQFHILVLATIGLFLLIGICGWNTLHTSEDDHYPADQELLTTFSTHRSAFTQLQTMFTADLGLCVTRDVGLCRNDLWSQPLPPERLAQYQALLHTVNVREGASGQWKNGVWLYAYSTGGATTGTDKGYVYLSEPPAHIVPDLESAPHTGDAFLFRHIEGNWYLFLILS